MDTTTHIKKVEKKLSGKDSDTIVITTTNILKLNVSGKEKPSIKHFNKYELKRLTSNELEVLKQFLDGRHNIKSTISSKHKKRKNGKT